MNEEEAVGTFKGKLKKAMVVSLAALLGLVFLVAGGSKLVNPESAVESFARWGYAPWFVYVTGFVEVAGAALVLVARVRFIGAVLLGVTMVGAFVTHWQAGESGALPVPLVLLVLAVIVGWLSLKTPHQAGG